MNEPTSPTNSTLRNSWQYLSRSVLAVGAALGVLTMPGLVPVGPSGSVADAAESRIVNGLATHDYPATGALLRPAAAIPIHDDNARLWCSGVLIGCSTFLTAAHCVEHSSEPSHYRVLLQHGGLYDVAAINLHPEYTISGFPARDVAVVHLATPVTGIDPAPWNNIGPPAFGSEATIVGFGRTRGSAADYGVKRFGAVRTVDCDHQDFPLGNDELLCWRFEAPVGSPSEDSNSCNGDSGGPLFVTMNGVPTVAGVTSGGNSADCLANDQSYDANVYSFRSFIAGELGSDATESCGLPGVGGPGADSAGFTGLLDSSRPAADHSFAVRSGATEARFVFHGELNGTLRANFYVKAGPGASPEDFDCSAEHAGAVGECIFANPPAGGAYSVHIARTAGAGQYQVTSAVFGGDPPVCGNGLREGDEECDGSDAADCDGLCLANCLCPTPVCGNNVREAGELCDGEDVGNCGGVCAEDCACAEAVGCPFELETEGCRIAASAAFKVNEAKAGSEKVKGKLLKIGALGPRAFGDPVAGSVAHDLCVYDGVGKLAGQYRVARVRDALCQGDFCWTPRRNDGFHYLDKELTRSGIQKLLPRAGKRPRVKFVGRNKAKKIAPTLPVGVAAALVGQGMPALQFRALPEGAETAACVTAALNKVKKQTEEKFTGIRKR